MSNSSGAEVTNKRGMVGQFADAVKANSIKAIASGVCIGVGIVAATLWSSAGDYVQARIDKSVAQALEAKTSETKKALFDLLTLSVVDQKHQFRDSVVRAVREATEQSEARKVGALTSGTIELRSQYPEHTIYFYLPQKNRGELWLSVQPRNAIANSKGAIASIILDNTNVAGFVPNESAEYRLDLNEKLSQAANTQRGIHTAVLDPDTGLPPQQPLQPARMRFGDLHTVTFRARKEAFGTDGNANIWIKYLVLVSPTITME